METYHSYKADPAAFIKSESLARPEGEFASTLGHVAFRDRDTELDALQARAVHDGV